MGHDYGGHKAIAKAIKAKGLQKLKYYCQMCEKQCRDANGFKCHNQSEAHLRQMALYNQNPEKFTSKFSEQFKKDFVDLLRTRYCNQRVLANKVYNEYIADRHHVHMNSTRWSTLGAFARTLGEEGIAEVQEEAFEGDSEGSLWYIRYIKRDENKIRMENERRKRDANDLDAEQMHLMLMEKQRQKHAKLEKSMRLRNEEDANNSAGGKLEESTTTTEPITFSIKKAETTSTVEEDVDATMPHQITSDHESVLESFDISSTTNDFSSSSNNSNNNQKRKRSNMEALIEEEERRKRRLVEEQHSMASKTIDSSARTNPSSQISSTSSLSPQSWLHKNIVVKVLHKTLGDGKYYKQKGVVKKVKGTSATIEMLKMDDALLLDQQYLETVIPQIGNDVRILVGQYSGERATLERVDFDKYSATLKLKDGTLVHNVPYEHFAKHHSSRRHKKQ